MTRKWYSCGRGKWQLVKDALQYGVYRYECIYSTVKDEIVYTYIYCCFKWSGYDGVVMMDVCRCLSYPVCRAETRYDFAVVVV